MEAIPRRTDDGGSGGLGRILALGGSSALALSGGLTLGGSFTRSGGLALGGSLALSGGRTLGRGLLGGSLGGGEEDLAQLGAGSEERRVGKECRL